jgi:ubiquinol-cytochrome c reductase iron-sulfur subunit
MSKTEPTTSPNQGIPNPGLPPHRPRRADTDPKAARRAELQSVALLALSILGTVGAVLAYLFLPLSGSNADVQKMTAAIGIGIFLGMMGIGAAAIHWAKTLMRDQGMVEERHPIRSSDDTREAAVQLLKDGVEDSGAGIGRRGLLKGAMLTALAVAPLSVVVPMIGNLGGDYRVDKLKHTMWKKGLRLTRDPDGTPIKASDVTIGSVFHVIPDGLHETEHPLEEKAKAVVLLIRLDPRDLNIVPGREDWSFDGIVAYSKICTHVGCPVALYEQQTHHLLCPCHQSTFDVANGCKVIFGPAKRPLPQLPISVDSAGYIVAQRDFEEPIGPGFWERVS